MKLSIYFSSRSSASHGSSEQELYNWCLAIGITTTTIASRRFILNTYIHTICLYTMYEIAIMSHMLLLFERTGENCSMLVAFDKLIYFSFFRPEFWALCSAFILCLIICLLFELCKCLLSYTDTQILYTHTEELK